MSAVPSGLADALANPTLPPPRPALAAASSSSLSSEGPSADPAHAAPGPAAPGTSALQPQPPAQGPEASAPPYSAQAEAVLQRISTDAAAAAASVTGTPGWEAARERVMREDPTAEKAEGGTSDVAGAGSATATGMEMAPPPASISTPAATAAAAVTSRGSTRGRPRGRGRGRGAASGRAGGKRKRGDRDDHDDPGDGAADSDSSVEISTPAATQTKSGRAIQKPTPFVPPPPAISASPGTGGAHNPAKRRKAGAGFPRKNPETAVCATCRRGTSPAGNMIVFCDGCNTPYHRYCHHPPIEQVVVDEVEREWRCAACGVVPAAVAEESGVEGFVGLGMGGGGVLEVGEEERRRWFGGLGQGVLVSLLVKVSGLRPELPVFGAEFVAAQAMKAGPPPSLPPGNGAAGATNGHAYAPPQSSPLKLSEPNDPAVPTNLPAFQAQATPAAAPAATTRPIPPEYPVPPEHPPTYPRPGNGLMRELPPEREDETWLVDDGDRSGAIQHLYRG
ncbi:hypothetical protein LTR53_003167 [Teratosphaeriaceae sp. CCFEE 6253]|nr:hypothetical protein LTR53_003167 [Teratosphaeriaceae sp. CCFEE 6253]